MAKASRTKSVHWLWRDLRLSFIVLVFGAFGIGAILYLNGWRPSQRGWSDLLFGSTNGPRVVNPEMYTGSIIMVPDRGDQCWQLLFDNRTGEMREYGHVDCYSVVSQLVEEKEKAVSPSKRIHVISNAFRGE